MIAVASVLSRAQTGQAYRFRRTVDGHKVDDVFRRRSGGSDHLAVGGQTVRVRRDCDDRVRRFVRDDAVAVAVAAEKSDDFPVVLPRKIAGNGNIVPRPRRSAGSGVAGLIQKCRQNPAQHRRVSGACCADRRSAQLPNPALRQEHRSEGS